MMTASLVGLKEETENLAEVRWRARNLAEVMQRTGSLTEVSQKNGNLAEMVGETVTNVRLIQCRTGGLAPLILGTGRQDDRGQGGRLQD